MSNILLRGKVLIRVVVGSALLGGTDVDLIVLQTGDLLDNTCNNPSSVAKTRVVKTNGEKHKTETDGVVNEWEGEGTGSVSPDE